MLTAAWPRAGPTGGLGFAWTAGSWSFKIVATAAIQEVMGQKAEFVVSPGTYDQKHIDRIGRLKNCVAYGPGILELAHQPDEWPTHTPLLSP